VAISQKRLDGSEPLDCASFCKPWKCRLASFRLPARICQTTVSVNVAVKSMTDRKDSPYSGAAERKEKGNSEDTLRRAHSVFEQVNKNVLE
jgi:hypothetical protein